MDPIEKCITDKDLKRQWISDKLWNEKKVGYLVSAIECDCESDGSFTTEIVSVYLSMV